MSLAFEKVQRFNTVFVQSPNTEQLTLRVRELEAELLDKTQQLDLAKLELRVYALEVRNLNDLLAGK